MKTKGIAVLCGLLVLCLAAGAAGEAAPGDGYDFADIMALIVADAEKAARIEALTAEVEALRAEVDRLTGEVKQLTQANAEYQQEIADLAEKAAGSEETADLRARLDAAVAAREQLDRQLEETIAVLETVNTERNQLKQQLESAAAAQSGLEARAAALAEELEAARAQQPAAPAAAEDLSDVTEGEFLSTRRYIHQLKAHSINYTVYGPDADDEREEVLSSLRCHSDEGEEFFYDLEVFFYPEDNEMGVRIWNLINFEAVNLNAVRRVCDAMNGSYKWVSFFTDSSDNSVTVSVDQRLLDAPGVGDLMWRTVSVTDSIIATAYDYLKPYKAE